MDLQIKNIAKNLGLKPAQVEGLICLLLQGPIDNQDLIRRTGFQNQF